MNQPNTPATPNFFNQEMADAYDRRNSALQPISGCLHFLTNLVLAPVPGNASVLCVGVGTGAEIFALASNNPDWRFVGVDPAAEMLEVCRHRLGEAGLLGRCQLVHGTVEDIVDTHFDAAVSLFVAHFIKLDQRAAFYRAIHQRLKPRGLFVSAEISVDLEDPLLAATVEDWARIQSLMGQDEKPVEALIAMFRDPLGVVSPDTTEALWRDAGFADPVPFFHAFAIRGWHAQRPSL
ncbi:MAG: class I SAM-dependent methyltransferase [Tsuneonella suprasediminis]|uniref:Class I SAM-dependent methyltransferase n=1 Tax=Tsuneonella suprasediminis TaxID=2306996 RepID=A0A419R1E4_9SPHN|nr:class I SAM-dependent methyltransferase [Tsuneonella suprasediminis]RJX67776.1 class I SAM-dependent methyltransferase [Tsuneonella suprasediminis]UBS33276.1 class I SAM-dependent methyltransferase [Altererythrobacter sp. N1]